MVEVGVSARDADEQAMEPLSFRFRIEGQDEESAAQVNIPETVTSINQSGSKKTVKVVSGPLAGASIVYDSTMLQQIGVEPYFGPVEEIPPLTTAEAVGVPLNLLPPAAFPEGVTIVIPCPGVSDPSSLAVYYYDGRNWVLACDSAGNLRPGGEGWMVPGSRINHNAGNGTAASIEIQVYHFSAAVAGDTPTVSAAVESENASCFISALGGK